LLTPKRDMGKERICRFVVGQRGRSKKEEVEGTLTSPPGMKGPNDIHAGGGGKRKRKNPDQAIPGEFARRKREKKKKKKENRYQEGDSMG